MIDLHSHSTASDGQYSPADLMQKAFDRGVTVMALTDHDTTAGLKEAGEKATQLGMTFVPGIEINIFCPGREFHLLGLGLEKISESMIDLEESLHENRESRNLHIIEKLQAEGIKISLEEVQADFKGESLGRPHIASWLENHKIVKNRQQAFDKYLARGRSCFVERSGAQLEDAVQAIMDCGGVPVIAHPLSLYLSWVHLEEQLAEYRKKGVLGMEAYHPCGRVVECERLEQIARLLGFFVTAGSDFHGEQVRRDRRIGITCGERKIEERFWEQELKPALESVRHEQNFFKQEFSR